MRCEHCGCVGVEVTEKLDRKERAKVFLLGTLGVKPGLRYAASVKTQPYCVRCKKRVKGDGVARRDVERLIELEVAVESEVVMKIGHHMHRDDVDDRFYDGIALAA